MSEAPSWKIIQIILRSLLAGLIFAGFDICIMKIEWFILVGRFEVAENNL